ncbi:hypothetical protein HDU79_011752 [Rhizoclosmatium sp. JEL0117]|nr:hypothetical protein HDU79_011752 [Rhizoclosmatium sp. JEL0117]
MTVLDEAITEILRRSDLSQVSVKAVRKELAAAAGSNASLLVELEALDKEGVKARINEVYERVVDSNDIHSHSHSHSDVKHEHEHELETNEDEDNDAKLARQIQAEEDEAAAALLDRGSRRGNRRAAAAPASSLKKKKKSVADDKDSRRKSGGAALGTGFSKPMVLSPALADLMRRVAALPTTASSGELDQLPDTLDLDSDIPSSATAPSSSPVKQDSSDAHLLPLKQEGDVHFTVTNDSSAAGDAIKDDHSQEPFLLSRPEVVKRLWVWIKHNNLQDPSDKRSILCDPLLESVFKLKKINMFKVCIFVHFLLMNKFLGNHLKSASDVLGVDNQLIERHTASVSRSSAASSKKSSSRATPTRGNRDLSKSSSYVVDSDDDNDDDEDDDEDDGDHDGNDDDEEDHDEDDAEDDDMGETPKKASSSASKKKKPARSRDDDDDDDGAPKKKSKSVFSKPYNLSPELIAVVGSADPIPRHEAVKKIWEYIKGNNLQDPSDKRFILCDETLQKVLKAKRVSMFGMNKVLGEHLFPI